MGQLSVKPHIVAFLALATAFVCLYGVVFTDLVGNWLRDPNYSHGFVVPPLAGYLIWERRSRLLETPLRPTGVGLLVVLISAAALLIGTVGVEFFLMRTSAISMAAGIILFIAGWGWLRILAFPLGFLLLMIPIPAIVLNPFTFKLQLLASRLGVIALQLAQVPVLREGNVIALPQTTLEVAEACSGIRSLIALSALALVYGYFTTTSPLKRLLTMLASLPIAIVANGLRVAATGLAAYYIDPTIATGAIHTASGAAVFVFSLAMLATFVRVLNAFGGPPESHLQLT